LLPIADQDPAPPHPGGTSSSSHEQAAEPAHTPADLDDTLPYTDPDETLPYSDMFCHDTYGAFRVEQLQTAVHTGIRQRNLQSIGGGHRDETDLGIPSLR
jgi:hypothetical protein